MTDRPLRYQRCAFSTLLDPSRLYTPGHAWLSRQGDHLWRVGFTEFAVRILGELVELRFQVDPGDQIEEGEVIGSVEGFKAVSDLYAAMAGRFVGANPDVARDIELIQSDPQGRGWLYDVEGTPGRGCLRAAQYVSVIDKAIDTMLASDRGEETDFGQGPSC
ncbi:MAG: glycine cleavage system protein H [Planctomycetota bacterium]